MKIGIVGHEAAKFTENTQAKARTAIMSVLSPGDMVISGGCHLGGIDKWAIEEALALGLDTHEFLPLTRSWPGYKRRNEYIARESDKLVCIVVAKLPDTYTGMRFPLCYHCKTDTHIKSGGCWTMHLARKLGKETQLIVIDD